MATPNTSSYDTLLQELYSTERLIDLVHQACPSLARCKKTTDFVGRNHTFAWKYGGNEAVSDTIAHSQAALTGTNSVDVHLTRKTMLAVARIDCELLDVAFENKGAFVTAIDEEVGHIENSFIDRCGSMFFRNGGGAIGKGDGSYAVGGAVITLSDPRDIINFRKNMVLEMSDTDGNSGALRAGTLTVLSIDEDAGTVTCTGNVSAGIGAAVNSDYIFPQGAFGAGWAGLEAYCPASTSGLGTAFYGAVRSVSPNQLAGHRKTASGGTVEDALIDAATDFCGRFKGKPKQIIVNPYRAGILVRESAGRSSYIRTDSSEVKMGASKLMLTVPSHNGSLEIISDPYCQTDVAWFVDLDDFTIKGSRSGYVHMQKNKETGAMWFPVYNANEIEMRMASYANIKHRSPKNIMRVAF